MSFVLGFSNGTPSLPDSLRDQAVSSITVTAGPGEVVVMGDDGNPHVVPAADDIDQS